MGTTITAPTALEAYEATAAVYDSFTAHHRHDVWTEMLERILRPHGLIERGRLLDVGCGTGKSFGPWEDRGWSVVACDASPAMLRRAAAKAGPGTETLVADARALDVLGSFDLVTLVDDVVNYLEPGELVDAFTGAVRNLAPDGLLMFDVNTLLSYRTFFAETEVHEADGSFVIWRGRVVADAFAPGDMAEATLDAFVSEADGCWSRTRAVHRQHHHPVELLSAALDEAGLSVLGAYGADDDCRYEQPVDEARHTKVVVVARVEGR